MNPPPVPPPWYRHLCVQVLIAIGWFRPRFGESLEPLGTGFIAGRVRRRVILSGAEAERRA